MIMILIKEFGDIPVIYRGAIEEAIPVHNHILERYNKSL